MSPADYRLLFMLQAGAEESERWGKYTRPFVMSCGLAMGPLVFLHHGKEKDSQSTERV